MKDGMANKDTRKNLTPPPYLISYAVTRKCNLKCKHCYSDASEVQAPDELLTVEAKKAIG